MFHSGQINKTIYKLHEKVLRLDDYDFTLETLFEKDSTFPSFFQYVHCLLVEIFMVVYGMTENEILPNMCIKNTTNYNVSSQADLKGLIQ